MFAKLVGDYLLTFGGLELIIENAVECLLVNIVEGKTIELKQITRVLLRGQGVSKKLDVLNFLVKHLDDDKQITWINFIDSVRRLTERRNMLAHNMYGVENEEMIKLYYDKHGTLEESRISVDELEQDLSELNERYRQLFDSVIEIPLVEATIKKDVTYISKYPRLDF